MPHADFKAITNEIAVPGKSNAAEYQLQVKDLLTGDPVNKILLPWFGGMRTVWAMDGVLFARSAQFRPSPA